VIDVAIIGAGLVRDFGLDVHDQWSHGDALLVSNGLARRVSGVQFPTAYRFSAGAMGLIDGLAARLDVGTVTLGCPVSRVERGAGHVIVHTATRSISARSVVIATPPSLALSRGVIDAADLDPALSEAASAIAVWMGAVTKAVAVYPRPFWREAGLSGFVSAHEGPFNEIQDMSGADGTPAMLFGFGHSRPAGPAPTGDLFIEQLTGLLGPDAASPIDVRAIDWRDEPFTTPDQEPVSLRRELFGSRLLQRSTWDRQLYWTSTEAAPVVPGHLEGALAAAERTVDALTK